MSQKGLGVNDRHELDHLGMEDRDDADMPAPPQENGAARQFERFLAAHGVTHEEVYSQEDEEQLAPPLNTAGICWDGDVD